ncbi:MAG: hypothetical protein ACOCXV_00885 [Bacteroidota bacterium]
MNFRYYRRTEVPIERQGRGVFQEVKRMTKAKPVGVMVLLSK